MRFLLLVFLLAGCATVDAPPPTCSSVFVATIDQWKADGYRMAEQVDVPQAGSYAILQTPARTRSIIVGEPLYNWVTEPAKSQFQLQGVCTHNTKKIKYYIYDQPNATTDKRL